MKIGLGGGKKIAQMSKLSIEIVEMTGRQKHWWIKQNNVVLLKFNIKELLTNVARQLDRSEFNPEISLVHLAKLQQIAFSNGLKIS